MNYRHLLLASLVTSIVASCSLSPKEETALGVPDISKSDRTDLIEVNASLRPPTTSVGFVPISTRQEQAQPEPPAVVTTRRVEFTIGDQGPSASNGAAAGYLESTNGPMKMAPSYSDRPVPTRGMSRDMVVADLGQPAKTLAGKAGSEVWDYGTFRVFFHGEQVAFTRVW